MLRPARLGVTDELCSYASRCGASVSHSWSEGRYTLSRSAGQLCVATFGNFTSERAAKLVGASPLLVFPGRAESSYPLLFFSFRGGSLGTGDFVLLLSFLVFPSFVPKV